MVAFTLTARQGRTGIARRRLRSEGADRMDQRTRMRGGRERRRQQRPGRTARRRAAVMADVARLAGVSHQTVSRVHQRQPRTCARRRASACSARCASSTTGPTPSRARSSPAARSTLGVVSFDTTLYGPASTLFGIERAAHEAGYFVSIVSLRVARPRVGAERGRAAARAGRRRHPRDHPAGGARPRRCSTSPATCRSWPSRPGPTSSVPVVAVDQFAGARARHPAPARARPPRPSGTSPARATGSRRSSASTAGARRSRRAGARGPAAARRRLEPALGLRARPAARRRRRTSRRSSPPTTRWRSACCARCTRRGREVPRDVSVVGFDDIPEARTSRPPLTTVRQDFNEMGGAGPACCCSARWAGRPVLRAGASSSRSWWSGAAPPPRPPGERAGTLDAGRRRVGERGRHAEDDQRADEDGERAMTRHVGRTERLHAASIGRARRPRHPADGAASRTISPQRSANPDRW